MTFVLVQNGFMWQNRFMWQATQPFFSDSTEELKGSMKIKKIK